MTKVYLDPGHGGSDPGAVKYVTEKKVNLTMALACRDYLKKNGVTVKMSRETDKDTSINKMAAEANAWGADYVVSIHNNAGKGDGFEVYHTIKGGKGKTLAQNIEKQVKAIGQNSRGLKTKVNSNGTDYFGMIRLTNAPAVICEGAFVDNATDVKIIDTTAEQKKFGEAYAKGILATIGITISEKPEKEPEKPAAKPTATKRKISDVYNADKGLTVKEAIKAGQAITNIILGTSIPEDGIPGVKTDLNKGKILQWALNKDYKAGLNINGKIGFFVKRALGNHTVRQGETQYMVTALEVLLLMNGFNPHGVEIPGTFGAGCAKATGQAQEAFRITVDRIAGKDTFTKLIS